MMDSPWIFAQASHTPNESAFWETLFTLSNGYVGTRSTLEFESPHAVPGTFFADLYDPALAVRTEIANAPSWLPLRFRLDGPEPFHWDHVHLLEFRRSLDLRRGMLVTRARIDEAGRITSVEWTTLLHAVELHLALVWGSVVAENYDGRLAVESWLDGRYGNAYMGGSTPEVQTHHFRITEEITDSPLSLAAETAGRGGRLALSTRLRVDGDDGRFVLRRLHAVGEMMTATLRPGRPVGFHRLATFFHSHDDPDPLARARRLIAELESCPLDHLVRSHQDAWDRRWAERDVAIAGCPRARDAMRFGLFHLWQHMHPHSVCYNVAARGLSSEYHSGHFFFNTEFFKLPYWTLTDPDRARALLMFRIETLRAAREHAGASGHRGARYPEEADRRGDPAAPWEIRDIFRGRAWHEWSGREKVFLSAAVAWAICWYGDAAGDDGFMLDHGLEVLLETARYGLSLLVWRPERMAFSIEGVMGPDEYHYHVNNNLFTNFFVRRNIELAGEGYFRLKRENPERVAAIAAGLACTDEEVSSWAGVAALIQRPRTFEGGVLEQFDGYADLPDRIPAEVDANGRPRLAGEIADEASTLGNFESRLIKEADVILLHALCPEAYPDEQKARDLGFYDPRTTFESSLAAAPYGVVAAMVGRSDLAEKYYSLSARFNLDYLPREGYRNGLHLAAYAGAWQIIVQGFLGLRCRGDVLDIGPRPLPESWSTVSLKLIWRGIPVRVHLGAEYVELRAEPDDGAGSIPLRCRAPGGEVTLLDLTAAEPLRIALVR